MKIFAFELLWRSGTEEDEIEAARPGLVSSYLFNQSHLNISYTEYLTRVISKPQLSNTRWIDISHLLTRWRSLSPIWRPSTFWRTANLTRAHRWCWGRLPRWTRIGMCASIPSLSTARTRKLKFKAFRLTINPTPISTKLYRPSTHNLFQVPGRVSKII